MKREVMLVLMFILFLIFVPAVYATEAQQVENGYSCLENRINQSKCSSFSTEEKIFLVLSTGECISELVKSNTSISNGICWQEKGKSGCSTKLTAQAVFALNEKVDTTQAENWLLAQSKIPDGIDWFLEIETLETGVASCTITYSESTYAISIGENKKISYTNAGPFTLGPGGYWLKIPPSLYNTNLRISCNKNFLTTLLFMSKGSSTVHVSGTVTQVDSGKLTTERVESLCFTEGGSCNYEASLWAAFSLYTLGGYRDDIVKFMPYLTTMMDDLANQKYLPESFLYFLTGKFRTELLLKQDAGLYWQESEDRYYDTALALWPFYYESTDEKTNSISWLLDVQQKTGCWNTGNVRDTAFILYSIWPKDNTPPVPVGECENYYDCPEVSCNERSCEGGYCDWQPFGCEDDDGCCNSGCTIATDDDCEPGENICTSNTQCEGENYDEDPYCSDDGDVYKQAHTFECNSGVCIENIDEVKVQGCSNSEYCDAGECIPNGGGEDECGFFNPCPSSDQECVNNICVPIEPDCYSNDDCPSGESCINEVCIPNKPECSINNDCPTGEVCIDEFCEEECDCVNDNDCTINSICTNCMCIYNEDVCEIDLDCSTGENCINGECIPDECTKDGDCPTGEDCIDTVCIPEDNTCGLFDLWNCPDGKKCVSGLCVIEDLECYTNNDCPTGEECINEFCEKPCSCASNYDCLIDYSCIDCECFFIDDGICESNFDCSANENCINGDCVPDECVINNDCITGEICVDGECIPNGDECDDNYDCPINEYCIDGDCLPPEDECTSNYNCSANENCINGECIPDECIVDIDCDTGEDCVGGECMPNGDECDDDYDCQAGKICTAGSCTFDEECTIDTDCASGRCINNECIPDECSTNYECPVGEDCVDGTCEVVEGCEDDSDCSSGSCINNECISDECSTNYECPTNYICTNGDCIYEENKCGFLNPCNDGYSCINKVCVPDEVECYTNYDCPIGENCVDEKCEVVEGCEDDSDCSYGTCVNSECVSYGCEDDYDCDYGTCVNSECVSYGCEDDYDCDYGTCINNGCIPYSCITDNDCFTEGEKCIGGSCIPEETLDCQNEGYYCMSQSNCENNGGLVLDTYSCVSSAFACCDTEMPLKTCIDEGGDICSSEQECVDGIEPTVSNTAYGETCCVGGTCEEQKTTDDTTCAYNGGTCSDSCGKCEEENTIYSCDSGTCCIEKDKCGGGAGKWILIIFLLLLIVLSVLGIVFRDKLRTQWMKLKDKLGGKKEKKKFEMPLTSHPMSQGRILPRRILPPGQSQQHPGFPIRRPITSQSTQAGQPITRSPQSAQPGQTAQPVKSTSSQQPTKKSEEKPKGDLDEVLKKLKEMSK